MFKDKYKKKQIEQILMPEDYEPESRVDLNLLVTELKDSLTEQEKEVLDLLLDGKPAEEISDELNICKKTVYNISDRIKYKIKH